MTATIKAAISPFAQAKTEFDSNPMHFLNEDLASVPVSGIPEEFRKLSRYLPVIVLVPKSAVHDKTTTQKNPGPPLIRALLRRFRFPYAIFCNYWSLHPELLLLLPTTA